MHAHPGGVRVSTLVDLCTAKARLGVTDTDSDAVIQGVLDGAERAVVVFLGYDPSSAAATVYLDGNGTESLVLPRKPVPSAASITNVWLDEGGYYGSVADSFHATETLLTAGEDYYYKANSTAGILVRMGSFWPVAKRRPLGRLGWEYAPLLGCVKVQFTSGLSPTEMADIAEAIYAMFATLYQQRFGLGVPQSESLGGRSLSFSGPAGGSTELLYGPSVNATALALLRPHRLIPWSA
jgi:hypothetical protein